jgi:hypothetical protein
MSNNTSNEDSRTGLNKTAACGALYLFMELTEMGCSGTKICHETDCCHSGSPECGEINLF